MSTLSLFHGRPMYSHALKEAHGRFASYWNALHHSKPRETSGQTERSFLAETSKLNGPTESFLRIRSTFPQVAFGAVVTFVCPFNARTPATAPVNNLSSNIAT
jgi:hypothetical protein